MDIPILDILGPSRSDLVFKLWEVAIRNESIMVLGDSPDVCSKAVFIFNSLVYPLEFSGNTSPYFTVFDPLFNNIKEEKKRPFNLVIGVTNPLFLKVILLDDY